MVAASAAAGRDVPAAAAPVVAVAMVARTGALLSTLVAISGPPPGCFFTDVTRPLDTTVPTGTLPWDNDEEEWTRLSDVEWCWCPFVKATVAVMTGEPPWRT